MAVQGEAVNWSCCLEWYDGTRSFIAPEAKKSLNQRHCPVLQMKWITKLCFIRKLILNCASRQRYQCVPVCICTHLATPFFTFPCFFVTTIWMGKSSCSPTCPIMVVTTLLWIRFELVSRQRRAFQANAQATVYLLIKAWEIPRNKNILRPGKKKKFLWCFTET